MTAKPGAATGSAPSAVARALAAEQRRKRGVRAIKAAQRQLQLEDDTYRDLLHRLTGKRSATQLSLEQQDVVLDYLREQGAANPRRAGRDAGKRRPRPSGDRVEMMGKVHSLLDALGSITGQAHTLAYADAICRRNGWADAVDFCSAEHLRALVGALARTVRSKIEQAGAAGDNRRAGAAGGNA